MEISGRYIIFFSSDLSQNHHKFQEEDILLFINFKYLIENFNLFF